MTVTEDFVKLMKQEMAWQSLTIAIYLAVEAGIDPALVHQLMVIKAAMVQAEQEPASAAILMQKTHILDSALQA